MGNHYGLNESDKLESYGGLEYIREYKEIVDKFKQSNAYPI